ncbi:MAG: GEVED domain-containing protein [Crocinitomicaceae bacterium]
MKLISYALFSMMLLLSTAAISQRTHFDNKPYVPGEFLVQVKENANIRELEKLAPANYEFKIGEFISPPMRVYMITFNHNNVEHWQMQNWLYEQENIVSVADYNYKIEMRSTIPNDANFTQQWHHNNTGQTGGTTDADIDSDLAWDITTGGLTATNDDIVVCMIESGNLDHVDLTGNRWFNANEIPNNGIDDDGNGYTDDYDGWNPVAGNDNYGTGGHGTNCLGMIGAKGDNGTLVTGANWDVKLMVIGGYSISTQANAIAAYTYPLDMRKLWNSSGGTQGAFVVATSSSWGIDGANPNSYPLWCQFYDTLGYHGILNVGATTNSNFDVDAGGDMPTACASDYMIGVGRTDHNDATAGGYGQNTIELGAPGINVVTTANTNTTTSTTGTSFSCPLTAGVIGLAYSIPCTDFMSIVTADPKQGADLVLQALLDGVDVIPAFSTKFNTSGRLNSFNTINELMTVACSGSLCLTPSAINTANITDNSADITFTAYGSATATVFYWREVGAPTWTVVNPASSPINLTGLTSCTEYEYYFTSECGAETSGNSSTQTFTTTGCGQCIEGGYCDASATDAVDEWIEDFTIDTYTNTSGNDNGYGDFTTTSSIVLNKDVPYTIQVTPQWGGTTYDEYTRIWVDLDQNGTFDAADLLFDQGAADQNVVNGSITIPLTAVDGVTRMRVQMAYQGGGQATLPDVCGTFQWGEVEDYCVDIQPANPCNLTVTDVIVDATCNGGTDGSVDLTSVTGGTAPYTYAWTPGGETTTMITGGAGNYSVQITDAAACTSTFSYTIGEPTAVAATFNTTSVSCNGDTDGAIDMTVTGGTPTYTYSWSNAETTEDITGLAPGNYTVVVTDANGCAENFNATVNEPAVLTGSTTTTDIMTGNDGAIDLSVSGGTPPYSYDWDSGFATTQDLSDLSVAGTYICVITDANGCTTTVSGTIDSQVGIDEGQLSNLIIYPNPSHGMVNIAFKADLEATITIYNTVGQKLMTTNNLGENILTLDLNDFATGVYVIQINTVDGAQRIERVTIKK